MKNKNLILIALISLLMVQSCFKNPEPSFSYLPGTNPEAGDTIFFKNTSVNATAYEWNLGNGVVSTESEPYTIYATPGNYDVTLKALYKQKTDSFTQSITINEPTVLEFTTYRLDTVNPIFNDSLNYFDACTVWIYESEANWDKWFTATTWEEVPDPEYFGITDSEGFISVSNLEARTYYLVFYKVEGTDEYIAAGPLGPITQNTVNAYWVAVYKYEPARKSSNRSTSKLKPVGIDVSGSCFYSE